MEQNKGDMVMRFRLKGRDVSAESMLRIAEPDALMQDFQRDTDYADGVAPVKPDTGLVEIGCG